MYPNLSWQNSCWIGREGEKIAHHDDLIVQKLPIMFEKYNIKYDTMIVHFTLICANGSRQKYYNYDIYIIFVPLF